jgi:hypothetical protein
MFYVLQQLVSFIDYSFVCKVSTASQIPHNTKMKTKFPPSGRPQCVLLHILYILLRKQGREKGAAAAERISMGPFKTRIRIAFIASSFCRGRFRVDSCQFRHGTDKVES